MPNVVLAQSLGYTTKIFLVLDYWVQLSFNFTLVSVRQV